MQMIHHMFTYNNAEMEMLERWADGTNLAELPIDKSIHPRLSLSTIRDFIVIDASPAQVLKYGEISESPTESELREHWIKVYCQ